jgi:hypothetical protein
MDPLAAHIPPGPSNGNPIQCGHMTRCAAVGCVGGAVQTPRALSADCMRLPVRRDLQCKRAKTEGPVVLEDAQPRTLCIALKQCIC